MPSHQHYVDYYTSQAGGGMSTFYRGSPYQKGAGIGSFLGGIFRRVLPFIKSGAKTVVHELARSGAHALADVAAGEPVKATLKRHIGQAGENLSNKLADRMQGNGIRRPRLAKKRQSPLSARPSKTSRKKNASLRDIFHS